MMKKAMKAGKSGYGMSPAKKKKAESEAKKMLKAAGTKKKTMKK